MARLALSRRLGAKAVAPPMMNTTAGRSCARQPCRCPANAALDRLSPRSSRITHDGALRNDVGDGDRFFEHAPLGAVGAAFPDLDDVEVCQPDAAAGIAPRACDSAPRARARDPASTGRRRRSRCAWHSASRQHGYSSPAGCLRPRARPHLFEIVEGAHFRPEDVDDDVAGVDQHPVAMRHALDANVADAGFVQGLRPHDRRSRRPDGWTGRRSRP